MVYFRLNLKEEVQTLQTTVDGSKNQKYTQIKDSKHVFLNELHFILELPNWKWDTWLWHTRSDYRWSGQVCLFQQNILSLELTLEHLRWGLNSCKPEHNWLDHLNKPVELPFCLSLDPSLFCGCSHSAPFAAISLNCLQLQSPAAPKQVKQALWQQHQFNQRKAVMSLKARLK